MYGMLAHREHTMLSSAFRWSAALKHLHGAQYVLPCSRHSSSSSEATSSKRPSPFAHLAGKGKDTTQAAREGDAKKSSESKEESKTSSAHPDATRGQKPKEEKKPEGEEGSPFGALLLLALVGVGGYFFYSKGKLRDDDSEVMKSLSYPGRVYQRVKNYVESFNEPMFDKLLPEPMKGPEAKPYTLVIDLDNFLVHRFFDANMGKWRTAKRPELDMFLFYMAHFYEVVLFSHANQFDGEQIMEALDPMQFVQYRLYRFATKYKDGHYIRDISKLNRDPSKIIVLAVDQAYQNADDNVLHVKAWKGETDDHFMSNSIDMLEALAFSGVDDIRPLLKKFDDTDPFGTFEKNQRQSYESLREIQNKSMQSGIRRFLYSMFGFDNRQDPTNPIPMNFSQSYEERKAEFASLRQAEYKKEYARIKEHFDRQMAAQKQYLASQKMGMLDMITKGPVPPPPELLQPPPVTDPSVTQ